MNCKDFQNELPDLILTPGAKPSLAAQAHLKVCPPCTEELASFGKTFAVLDTWTAPEPTPYFAQKMQVRLREEQAAPKMGWFESLKTRLLLNTGHQFRPALAGGLALALVLGIGAGGVGLQRNTLRFRSRFSHRERSADPRPQRSGLRATGSTAAGRRGSGADSKRCGRDATTDNLKPFLQ